MTEPGNNVLENGLGKNYKLFKEFDEKIRGMNLIPEWHYYNDGKSWLCKVLNKKKNLCWLSVWNTGFKLTFYFTEKTLGGIFELDISEDIKKKGRDVNKLGKLIPVLFFVISR